MGSSYTGPLQPCLTRREKLTDGLHWMFILCHWMRGRWEKERGRTCLHLCKGNTSRYFQLDNRSCLVGSMWLRRGHLCKLCSCLHKVHQNPSPLNIRLQLSYIKPHQLTDVHGSHTGKQKDERKAQWRPHSSHLIESEEKTKGSIPYLRSKTSLCKNVPLP